MPSFDVVSEVDMHELQNAIDQTEREVTTRFDFKGSNAKIEKNDNVITLTASNDFQIKQMLDILYQKMAKRGIDIQTLDVGKIEPAGKGANVKINVRQGIDKELSKKIVKYVKDSKVKVQAAIQGEQVRITGKKRDDLQEIIALLRTADLGLPLQYTNFRD